MARHPGLVATLVAHEPPLASLVEDRDVALAVCRDIQDTYRRSGSGPAMAKFIGIVSHKGLLPDGYLDQPAPDPAMFGMPAEDDGSRDDPLLGQNIVTSTHFEPDFGALAASPTRIVVAAGVGSVGELAHRGAVAVAERLGTAVTEFPGDHGGFLGGEYGQMGEPDAFAARLRGVLASSE